MFSKKLLISKVENNTRKLIYTIDNLYKLKQNGIIASNVDNQIEELFCMLSNIEAQTEELISSTTNLSTLIKYRSSIQTTSNESNWEEFTFLHGSSPWDFILLNRNPAIIKVINSLLGAYIKNLSPTLCLNQLCEGDVVCYVGKKPFRGILIQKEKTKWHIINLDSGYSKLANTSDIYYLPNCIKEIPSQAILCTLSKELWLKDMWPEYLKNDFLNTMSKSSFLMRIIEKVSITYPDIYYVELIAFDETTGQQINLTNWFNRCVHPYLLNRNYQVNEYDHLHESIFDPYLYVDCESDIIPEEQKYESSDDVTEAIFDACTNTDVKNIKSTIQINTCPQVEKSERNESTRDDVEEDLSNIKSTIQINTCTQVEKSERNESTRDDVKKDADNIKSTTIQINTCIQVEESENNESTRDDVKKEGVNPPLLYIPSAGEAIRIKVTAITSANSFKVQIAGKESRKFIVDDLENDILSSLQNYDDNKTKYLESLPMVGDKIIALTLDNNCRRGTVRKIIGSRVIVYFCDYGIKSNVTLDNIRRMEVRHSKVPDQVVSCNFRGVKKLVTHSQARKRLTSLLSDKILNAVVYRSDAVKEVIELDFITSDGQSAVATLIQEGIYGIM